MDEAMRHAPEAIAAYAEALAEDGKTLPPARRLNEIKADPAWRPDLDHFLVALVEAPLEKQAA